MFSFTCSCFEQDEFPVPFRYCVEGLEDIKTFLNLLPRMRHAILEYRKGMRWCDKFSEFHDHGVVLSDDPRACQDCATWDLVVDMVVWLDEIDVADGPVGAYHLVRFSVYNPCRYHHECGYNMLASGPLKEAVEVALTTASSGEREIVRGAEIVETTSGDIYAWGGQRTIEKGKLAVIVDNHNPFWLSAYRVPFNFELKYPEKWDEWRKNS